MAQQTDATDAGSMAGTEAGHAGDRRELPTNRHVSTGDGEEVHLPALSAEGLHYLTEAAILELDEHGSTRMLMHDSLFGHAEIMRGLFEEAKAEYDRRIDAGMPSGVREEHGMTDAQVRAFLMTVRDRRADFGELVEEGMLNAASDLARQTPYDWHESVNVTYGTEYGEDEREAAERAARRALSEDLAGGWEILDTATHGGADGQQIGVTFTLRVAPGASFEAAEHVEEIALR
jgi:hypothetical protein